MTSKSHEARSPTSVVFKVVRPQGVLTDLHVFLDDGRPVVLGTGRYAVVIAASDEGANFFALKFLKTDKDSIAASKNNRTRFFEEISHTSILGTQNQPSFVRYVGYSSIAAVADASAPRPAGEDAFEGQFSPSVIEEARAHNVAEAEKLSRSFRSRVQGEFYAMEAEEGTVEDLLFYEGDWTSRAIFDVSDTLRRRNEEISGDSINMVRAFFNDLRNETKRPTDGTPELPPDNRGIAILHHISQFSPSTRNLIVLSLVARLTRCVRSLHKEPVPQPPGPEDETARKLMQQRKEKDKAFLSHRDLKPGNFLFSFSGDNVTVRLADLGFVGRTTVNLQETIQDATREPGNIDGSYLYRAPEQMAPSVEIKFQTDTVKKPANSKEPDRSVIRFFDVARMYDAQPGDWLECQDLRFGSDSSGPEDAHDAIHKYKSVIECVNRLEGDLVEATLRNQVRPGDPKGRSEYEVGHLTKPSGQHSDIFALGSMLYLLATCGKNPERFFVKCLDFAIESNGREEVLSPQGRLGQSCLSLALALCLDDSENIVADFEPYWAQHERDLHAEVLAIRPSLLDHFPKERRKASDSSGSRSGGVGVFLRRLRGAPASRPERQAVQYASLWRKSPVVDEYLSDQAGNPLPFPIVYECIRCMLRDRGDSYVRRGTSTDDLKKVSYLDQNYVDQTRQLFENLDLIRSNAPCATSKIERYQGIGDGDPLKLFLHLRIAMQAIRPRGSKTGLQHASK